MERLPQVREIAINFVHTDPITDLAPIQPTAHYSIAASPRTRTAK